MIRPDGRRQIVDLLLPDDCFGFTNGAEYDDTVEAVVADTYAVRCSRRDAEAVADANPELAREIRQAAFEAMSRLQAQLVIVGRVTAIEKVGGYLLEMSARMSSRSSEGLVLPMSRYEIADYLGLSVETVSRSLTHLKERGAIKLLGPRSVRILDRAALEGDAGPRRRHVLEARGVRGHTLRSLRRDSIRPTALSPYRRSVFRDRLGVGS